MLSKILVAYDDSASARRALEAAVHVAQAERASLVVVAVRDRLSLLDGASAAEVRAEHERRQDACYLWPWAAEDYVTTRGLAVRTEIRAGNIVICDVCAGDGQQDAILAIGRGAEAEDVHIDRSVRSRMDVTGACAHGRRMHSQRVDALFDGHRLLR